MFRANSAQCLFMQREAAASAEADAPGGAVEAAVEAANRPFGGGERAAAETASRAAVEAASRAPVERDSRAPVEAAVVLPPWDKSVTWRSRDACSQLGGRAALQARSERCVTSLPVRLNPARPVPRPLAETVLQNAGSACAYD